jgi:hypothetical protein
MQVMAKVSTRRWAGDYVPPTPFRGRPAALDGWKKGLEWPVTCPLRSMSSNNSTLLGLGIRG